MKISAIKNNPRNPRKIAPEALEKLKDSIQRDPEFMVLRPIVVDDTMVVLGGNQRLKAIKALGMKDVPDAWVRRVEWDGDKAKRFNVVDNKVTKCVTCGELFYSKKVCKTWSPKYCNQTCYGKQLEGKTPDREYKKGTTPWNKGLKMWEGKEHPRGTLGKIGMGKGRKHSKETRAKLSEAHKGIKRPGRAGENCNFWKGGVTSKNEADRKKVEYREWRDAVFERDKYTCQKCGVAGGHIHSHHIKPFCKNIELRFDVNNGQTLCMDCHGLVHGTTFVKRKSKCPSCGSNKKEHRIICKKCEVKEKNKNWLCIECGEKLKGRPQKEKRRCRSCAAKIRMQKFRTGDFKEELRVNIKRTRETRMNREISSCA